MWVKFFALLFLLTVSRPPTIRLRKGLREHRKPKAWTFVRKAKDADTIEFTFMLKKQNLDNLEKLFWSVSNPKSPAYRKFLKPAEIDEMVSAKKEDFETVKRWLKMIGKFEIVKQTSDALKVRTNVRNAKLLFQTKFEIYQHDRLKTKKIVFTGKLTLPGQIAKIVDFVRGISELWEHPKKGLHKNSAEKKTSSNTTDKKVNGTSDVTIDPAMLRRFYNIPANETNKAPQNYMAVAAFSDYYSHAALKEFYQKVDQQETLPNITDFGIFCLDNDEPCDQFESDLDIQYITAIGKGVDTLFHGMPTADGWMLDFTEEVLNMERLPLVISISYGFAELLQCYVDEANCEKLGYTADKYVAAVNVNWQKIALAGMAVIVADGDDGAVGVISEGSAPIDLEWWCPNKDCGARTSSQCAQFILTNEHGETCQLPAGTALCDWIPETFDEDEFLEDLNTQNEHCTIEFYEDGSENLHIYSDCTCDKLSYTKALDGMTLNMKQYSYNSTLLDFYADFPASSPYITSLGATMLLENDLTGILQEVTASIKQKAIITTGGGFSSMSAQPQYQAAQVTSWYIDAPNKPPKEQYDISKRAYPDTTAAGHAYLVVFAEDGGDECPCQTSTFDGTSASAPMFAGMISLLNGYLLENGEAPLGFLNPLLYQMYGEAADTFNDLISGDNKCTRSYCFEHGYDAVPGWDPVGGLGSVDYLKMKEYVTEKLMKKN